MPIGAYAAFVGAYAAFDETYDWGEDEVKVQAEGERAVVNPRMRELLVTIVSILPEVQF